MSDIDPEKLEEALEHLATRGTIRRSAMMGLEEHVEIIASAARAYLATVWGHNERDVWRVEYAVFRATVDGGEWVPRTQTFLNHQSALDFAAEQDVCITCVVVTGPHKQRVPA